MPKRQKVLAVDDEEINRLVIKAVLEESEDGHKLDIEFAEDGEDALEKARAGRFDLILLDVEMPKLDGISTLRELKKDLRLREIPVLMVSGVNQMASVVECISLGAED